MARNKRNLLQESGSQPTPGTSGQPRKKSLLLLLPLSSLPADWPAVLFAALAAPAPCAALGCAPFRVKQGKFAKDGLITQCWGPWGASRLPPSSAPVLCTPDPCDIS